ncbi:MAG: hypothetical protein NW216_05290 [Hyphomicrobium sp.]|nr:hypothetical protein [Hyphomicrobium sp.]
MAALSGILYFSLVFGAGFILGTIRVLFLAPVLGAMAATLLEIPIILAVSWVACRWIIQRFHVPPSAVDRVVMGAVAFACLMVAEFGLAIVAFGRTLVDHLATYQTASGLAGLVAQVIFATLPVVHLKIEGSR